MFDYPLALEVYEEIQTLKCACLQKIQPVEAKRDCPKTNMQFFVAMRQYDLIPLQEKLARLGLSTLGRSHPYILQTLDAIETMLEEALKIESEKKDTHTSAKIPSFCQKQQAPLDRILITIATDFTQENATRLVNEGVGAFRINTGRDTPKDWIKNGKIIQELQQIMPCSAHIDLAGPKIRTGMVAKKGCSVSIGDYITFYPDERKSTRKGDKVEVGCTHADVLAYVKVGERIVIDEGKIALSIIKVNPKSIVAKVTFTLKPIQKIKEHRSINFPDTDVLISAITPEDETALNLLLPYVNQVAISFVNTADDIRHAQRLLKDHSQIRLVAKIETKTGLKNLPFILEALYDSAKNGVMIARGDLAVEAGFENLPMIQNEIFELCEAAHIPVILATQILENLMKTNLPTRAEVLDLSLALRAQSLMLNRGVYPDEAVAMISYLVKQTEKLFIRNIPLLSPLTFWGHYINNTLSNTKENS